MKFIHVADIHLGANPDAGRANEKTRGDELWETFERLLNVCNEQKIDLLLIAGDIFHNQPLLRELKELDYLFSKLEFTKVVLIAGNHDYIKPTSFYKTFTWSPNVTMLTDSKLMQVTFTKWNLKVYGFSYHEKMIEEPIIDEARPNADRMRKILIAHGGDVTHVPFNKRKVSELGYDYVALGHIHKPKILIENKMAFAGALEPIDRNDLGDHGYILGTLEEDGIKTEFVTFAKRKYMQLNIKIDDSMSAHEVKDRMMAAIEKAGEQNIYNVVIHGFRNENMIMDTQNFDILGNIVGIIDDTDPFYDFRKLMELNKDNIIGAFIEKYIDYPKDSPEYEAMSYGVSALMEARRS
ncbi:MAG: exonuclease SbcCD subunit D [Suipraeoptans sp.]